MLHVRRQTKEIGFLLVFFGLVMSNKEEISLVCLPDTVGPFCLDGVVVSDKGFVEFASFLGLGLGEEGIAACHEMHR
jgi:hypothetical protein